MALQYSVAVRNARLDSVETTVGTAPLLRLYSGSAPANAAAAATGTMLCQMTLPSNWLADASSGTKALAGSWSGTGDAGAGSGTNAGYFRIYESTGTTCHLQGTVTGSGSGGDIELDNVSIASGQAVSVSSFQITAGNA